MDNSIKRGGWFKAFTCVKCCELLTNSEHFMNRGCCPYCGYSVEGTTCETNPIIIRRVEDMSNIPWWDFWTKPKTTYETKKQDGHFYTRK